MKKNYRIQLTMTLIIFTFTIASVITAINYYQFKTEMERKNELLIEQAIEISVSALEFVDESIQLHGKQIDDEMQDALRYLQVFYDENNDVLSWNLQALKKELGYDIYIINEANEIIQSNIASDIGINFEKCCQSLKKILDERRQYSEPFVDGVEISQKNDDLIKFGYITTNDKQFIIEIGLNIEGTTLETIYNYVNITGDIIEKFDTVDDLHFLNMGGYSYNGGGKRITGDRYETFREARDQHEITQLEIVDDKGNKTFYRYIPTVLSHEEGATKQKIIEVTYNERAMSDWGAAYTKRFIFQFAFILFITIILAHVIVKRFMRMSYLAYHDNLTGLENRLAFEEQLEQTMSNRDPLAISFIDLDRFKLINDHLGHQQGDILLQMIGNTMKSNVTNGTVYRLGGDEFMIIFTNIEREAVLQQINSVLRGVEEQLVTDDNYKSFQLSASAGVVFAQENDTIISIKEKADIALHHAKLKGKNQLQVYGE